MGIYNGCGGEGGIPIGKVVRHNIELFPEYKQEKAYSLIVGIEMDVCKPHDIRFYVGGGIVAYLIANWIFSYHFTLKFWWTNFFLQLMILPVMLIGMNIGGIRYFHWCMPWNKRTLPNIID